MSTGTMIFTQQAVPGKRGLQSGKKYCSLLLSGQGNRKNTRVPWSTGPGRTGFSVPEKTDLNVISYLNHNNHRFDIERSQGTSGARQVNPLSSPKIPDFDPQRGYPFGDGGNGHYRGYGGLNPIFCLKNSIFRGNCCNV